MGTTRQLNALDLREARAYIAAAATTRNPTLRQAQKEAARNILLRLRALRYTIGPDGWTLP